MARVILANGIRTDGEDNIDLLGASLRSLGLEVVDVLLPRRSVLSVRWGARRDGRALAQVSKPGDIIVGHSFGALRAAHALGHVEYRAVICIAPAMPSRYRWPDPFRVTCYHSATDLALKASRLLLAHPFGGGSGGLYGFDQPGVFNVPCHGLGHSDYFAGRPLGLISDRIRQLVESAR